MKTLTDAFAHTLQAKGVVAKQCRHYWVLPGYRALRNCKMRHTAGMAKALGESEAARSLVRYPQPGKGGKPQTLRHAIAMINKPGK